MARRRRNGDGGLETLIRDHVLKLVEAVRDEVRRSVADEVRGFLAPGQGGAGLPRAARKAGRNGGAKRVRPCIAPGCKNTSKGPRFHFLCDEHRTAPKKEWEAWQKQAREKTE
jgi:hypothetical protein